MARKLTYDINRFDGGMSDDIRVSDLSKCARVSHFDIYRDPHKLVPMPGFVADQDTTAGGADDLQNYSIRAFYYDAELATMRCVGETSGGGGSKVFEKAAPETSEWTASTNGEGTDDLSEETVMFRTSGSSSRIYYATYDATDTEFSYFEPGTGVTDGAVSLTSGEVTRPFTVLENDSLSTSYDLYLNTPGKQNVDAFSVDTFSTAAKSTQIFPAALGDGGEYIGIYGSKSTPYFAKLLLWDANSALVDRTVDFGKGRGVAVGYTADTWVGVVNEGLFLPFTNFDEYVNGKYKASIKVATGNKARAIYEFEAVTQTNAEIRNIDDYYDDAMIFYARIPADATPTTYTEGVFAVGQTKPSSPLAVSQLLDTSSLGSMQATYSFGNHMFFAHNGDGSVSRLDNFDTGSYDVECVYESLMLGHESPNLKNLNGISVHTEDLPASATVEVKFRTDENDSWTTLGTENTTGNEIHHFTDDGGDAVGQFQEIQFRVEINGKVTVKGIHISLTETDDTPYNY